MSSGAVVRLVAAATVATALVGCSVGSVEVEAPAPPAGDRAACQRLLDALPDTVADQEARDIEPEDAWGAAWGDPPIVLRCGASRPEGLDRTSTCTTVNGVDWFIPEEQLDSDEAVDLTMTTIYREQYVEVRLPAEHGPPATTLVDLAEAVRTSIPARGSCV